MSGSLTHTILEGHRFAIEPIAEGETLLSWGLPFGRALRAIQPGEYLCNAGILEALQLRNLDFALPLHANFENCIATYELDEQAFLPGHTGAAARRARHLRGLSAPRQTARRRDAQRHRPARHDVLERQLRQGARSAAADGSRWVRATSTALRRWRHTEGGGTSPPNNLEFVLRTLAGFIVNPNVAACLAVDYGSEVFTNAMLEDACGARAIRSSDAASLLLRSARTRRRALDECARIVREWFSRRERELPRCQPASPQPQNRLQCGGRTPSRGVRQPARRLGPRGK